MLETLLGSLEDAGYRRGDIVVADCPQATSHEGLARSPAGWSERTIRLDGQSEQLRRDLVDSDVIINVPSLTDHNVFGLGCALTNVSLPMIRRPARYMGPNVHEVIASICSDRKVMPPVVLTIVNALRCVYDGGPVIDESKVSYERSVWASTDMVAVDRLALEWLDQQRLRQGLETLEEAGRPAEYIQLAEQCGIGNADLRRIVQRKHTI